MANPEPELRRTMGLTSALSIVVGGVIGSGIFMKPLDIARNVPDPMWIYGLWAVLGVICLFGAFAYAELGCLFPEAGGQYAFLREGWGRFIGFLYGWCLFAVINTGTLAALAVAFAIAIIKAFSLPESEYLVPGLAAAMILSLAAVNHFGVTIGALFQNVSTFAKVAALAAITLGGLLFSGDAQPASAVPTEASSDHSLTLAGMITASVAIFWAYEGWYQLPFSAAELKNPEKTLPQGLVLGTFLLILIYLGVNAAYLHVVPVDEMRTLENDVDVPTLAVSRIFGSGAGSLVAFLIALSTIGSSNPSLLSTPRAFYAMAKDGLVFPRLMHVHPVHRTPTISIWTQAIWSVVLVGVLQTFRDITEFVIFAALIFYALAVAAVYVLRVRLKDRARAFRCPGYPFTPALFIVAVLFVDVQTLADPGSRQNALYGLYIIAAGAVLYFWLRRRWKPAAPSDTGSVEQSGFAWVFVRWRSRRR